MARLKWLAGLRRSEVCELPLVAVLNATTRMKTDPVPVEILGKGKKLRTVYISRRTLLELDGYIRGERKVIVRKHGTECDKFFVGRAGEELDPSAMNAAYDRNVAETGIEIHAHLLRHSFATEKLEYLVAQGVEPSQALLMLKEELGRASIPTTERYLHLSARLKRRAMLANNSFVDQQLGQAAA